MVEYLLKILFSILPPFDSLLDR